jgi:hypothetical protein
MSLCTHHADEPPTSPILTLLRPQEVYCFFTTTFRGCRCQTPTTVLPTRYRSPSPSRIRRYGGCRPITAATVGPALRHTSGFAIRYPGVRPIETCLFLHSKRSVTAPNRYQTKFSRKFQAVSSSQKTKKRTARRADHRPKRRAGATVIVRDENAALRTATRTTAITIRTRRSSEEKSADAERARQGALVEAGVVAETSSAAGT